MNSTKTLDRPRLDDIPPVWPPDDNGGGGGDSGSSESEAEFFSGRLGVWLVMAGVGMIFFAFIATYVFMQLDADTWPPSGGARLPKGMGYGTLIIAFSSLSVGLGQGAIRRGARQRFFLCFGVAITFGALFCVMQTWFWYCLLDAGLGLGGNRFTSSYFALTALHVAHVLGGLAYLAFALWSVFRRADHEIVDNAAMFWHFVGFIWLVLFLVLSL